MYFLTLHYIRLTLRKMWVGWVQHAMAIRRDAANRLKLCYKNIRDAPKTATKLESFQRVRLKTACSTTETL